MSFRASIDIERQFEIGDRKQLVARLVQHILESS